MRNKDENTNIEDANDGEINDVPLKQQEEFGQMQKDFWQNASLNRDAEH